MSIVIALGTVTFSQCKQGPAQLLSTVLTIYRAVLARNSCASVNVVLERLRINITLQGTNHSPTT